jgi:hypothetical protein
VLYEPLRIDVGIVRMMRIEPIREQEVDRARAVIRFTLRRSSRGVRRVGECGERKYRAGKYRNCVSDSRSHWAGLVESAGSVWSIAPNAIDFAHLKKRESSDENLFLVGSLRAQF